MRIKGRKILQWRVERKRRRVWRGGNNYLLNKYHLYNIFSPSGHQRIELMIPSVAGTLSSLVKARLLFYFFPFYSYCSFSFHLPTGSHYNVLILYLLVCTCSCKMHMFLSTFNLCFIILFTWKFSFTQDHIFKIHPCTLCTFSPLLLTTIQCVHFPYDTFT